MQIPAFAEQTLEESPLLGEIWGFEANGDFIFAFLIFLLVVATLNLATTERVGATITKKKNYFLLWATEELSATVRGGITLCLVTQCYKNKNFSFKGLTNQ